MVNSVFGRIDNIKSFITRQDQPICNILNSKTLSFEPIMGFKKNLTLEEGNQIINLITTVFVVANFAGNAKY